MMSPNVPHANARAILVYANAGTHASQQRVALLWLRVVNAQVRRHAVAAAKMRPRCRSLLPFYDRRVTTRRIATRHERESPNDKARVGCVATGRQRTSGVAVTAGAVGVRHAAAKRDAMRRSAYAARARARGEIRARACACAAQRPSFFSSFLTFLSFLSFPFFFRDISFFFFLFFFFLPSSEAGFTIGPTAPYRENREMVNEQQE